MPEYVMASRALRRHDSYFRSQDADACRAGHQGAMVLQFKDVVEHTIEAIGQTCALLVVSISWTVMRTRFQPCALLQAQRT